MSQDRTQDAFVNIFDFKKGEQPTATKLTGWVKLTDAAVSNILEIIGDPHDYTSHTATAGSLLLSPARLGQPTIARMIGPSDYISPQGGSVAEPVTATITVSLTSGRNSWSLGFPLVKLQSGSTVDTSTQLSDFEVLVWGTDIVSSSALAGHFITEKSSLEDLANDGDFYISYYSGIIYHYNAITSDWDLEIDNIHMFSAGVPWGTHNVIPTWEQTTKCDVIKVADVGDQTQYRVELPTVTRQPRIGAATVYGASDTVLYDALSCSGDSSYYRLPYSLTSIMTGGDAIPDGFMYLWDDDQGRVVPQCSFVYSATDSEHQVLVYTPTDWLTQTDTRYRLLVCGTSLAEAVNYLSCVVRDNVHAGLYAGGSASTTIAYTTPLSHDYLAERWAITGNAAISDISRYYFRESSYPTNCHPQYLHRGGYMEDDEAGNSANAMRGWMVFTSRNDNYALTDIYTAHTATYGAKFGWSSETAAGAFRLSFEGGESLATWTDPGSAHRLGYGIPATESQYPSITSYGALVLTPFLNAPLHLRGYYRSTPEDCDGAVLGFDLAHQNEMNYIKLWPGIKDYSAYSQANIPARTAGQTDWHTPLEITPDLSNRLSPDQTREFRFRGVAYCADSSTAGIGAPGSEFGRYFTSPSIVGADFINIYSNAIFFSEDGDGAKTSFHDFGEDWMNADSTKKPSGIYYLPLDGSDRARYEFWTYSNDAGNPLRVLQLGYENTGTYATNLTVNGDIKFESFDSNITIKADNNATTGTIANQADYFTATTSGSGSGVISLQASISTSNTAINIRSLLGGIEVRSYTKTRLYNTSSGAGEGIQLYTTGTGEQRIYLYAQNSINTNAIDLYAPSGGVSLRANSSKGIYLSGVPTGNYQSLSINGDGSIIYRDTSSKRYKTNITLLDDISWLYNLQPVSFSFKNDTSYRRYGFIAEDVAEINSEVVLYDGKLRPDSLAYNSIFSAMLKALQDQKKEIEELKAQINK